MKTAITSESERCGSKRYSRKTRNTDQHGWGSSPVQCTRYSEQSLLPGYIHIDVVCPDTTQLLFHYNNIQSPQCAGWRCGTMPPLTEPYRTPLQKHAIPRTCIPKKTTRIPFPDKQKTLHSYHRNTAASIHKLFSAMNMDCCRLKFGYYTDTTLGTAASRRTQSSAQILELTGFDSFVESAEVVAPSATMVPPASSYIVTHVRVRRVSSSFSSPVTRRRSGRRALWMRRLLLCVVCLLGTLWCPRRRSRCQLFLHLGLSLVLPS